MLSNQVVSDDLPLFRELDSAFKPIVQLLKLFIKVLRALWGKICSAILIPKTLVVDVQVYEDLRHTLIALVVANCSTWTTIPQGTLLASLLLSLEILSDLTRRCDLMCTPVSLCFLLLCRSLDVIDRLPDQFRLVILFNCVCCKSFPLTRRQVPVSWLAIDALTEIGHAVLE